MLGAVAPSAAQPPTRTQVACAGQTITEVVIRTQGPSYGGIFQRSPFLARAVTTLHVTTAPDVIRNFVLLERGKPCSPDRRTETERLLRAQPFIGDASVTAYQDGANGIRIEVVTVDEPSAVASLGVRNQAPFVNRAQLGNTNLLGRGVYAGVAWHEGEFYRDFVAVRYTNYQLWNRPYQLDFRASRRELGSEWSSEVGFPMQTDLQPYGWRVAAGRNHDFVQFLRQDVENPSLQFSRTFFDAGATMRFGRPGRLAIVGASLSVDRALPSGIPVLVTDSGIVQDTSSQLLDRYAQYRTKRANAVLGYRQVRFVNVSGFDALTGAQDVRTGVQVAAVLGWALPGSSSEHDRMFTSIDAYAGAGSRNSFAAVELELEARRDRSEAQWSGILGSGRAAWYVRPHRRHTVETSLEWSGGRRVLTPFQLSLGDRRGGIRGYVNSDVGGAARSILRLEDRWRIGNFRGTADAGIAAFFEVGRLWAGDAAYGVNTPWRPATGIGLLAAVPPRSRRLWRLDLAIPLAKEGKSQFEVRFTNEDRTRSFWREPNDVRRNRERALPARLLGWL